MDYFTFENRTRTWSSGHLTSACFFLACVLEYTAKIGKDPLIFNSASTDSRATAESHPSNTVFIKGHFSSSSFLLQNLLLPGNSLKNDHRFFFSSSYRKQTKPKLAAQGWDEQRLLVIWIVQVLYVSFTISILWCTSPHPYQGRCLWAHSF